MVQVPGCLTMRKAHTLYIQATSCYTSNCWLTMDFRLFILVILFSKPSISETDVKYASPGDYYKLKYSPDLRWMLDLSLYNKCKSDGSPGITCEGFSLGDDCLRDFLWCRDDFKLTCARGLPSNNEVFCGNRRKVKHSEIILVKIYV